MPRGTCCRGDAELRLSKVCLQDCFLIQDAAAFPQGAYKQALQVLGQSEGWWTMGPLQRSPVALHGSPASMSTGVSPLRAPPPS